jgi:transketolase
MPLSYIQGKLRSRILGLHHMAGSGHIGCSLSCIDLLIAIFNIKSPEDSFILSKGHAATALYSILNEFGEIGDEALATFYNNGTTLPAHPAPLSYPAIPFATGSLGHGLPIAAGIAKANKIKGNNQLSFVLMSDGETNEGTSWEAAHFATSHHLDNLIAIVDKNGLQGFDNTSEVLGDTASASLWQSMGFDVFEADGHDVGQIIDILNKFSSDQNQKPKLIIANTVKGKGISYMENNLEWHYLPMNEEQYQLALDEIKTKYHYSA